MKKVLLLSFTTILISSVTVFSQTHLNINFSGTFPPSGWTFDSQPSNWESSATTNAGGNAPECKFEMGSAIYRYKQICFACY